MKTPRYTDEHKYPHGYAPAAATDIRRTYARARAKLKLEAERKAENVRPIKQAKR